MNQQLWHPGTLLQLSGSYWQAFALHAAVKLDLFSCLADKPLTAEQVAARLSVDERALAMLMNAVTAMGLIEKNGHRYDLSDAARRLLVKGAEGYIGHIILHHHFLSPSWAALDKAVQTGQSQRSRASHSEDQEREAFLMGMFNLAMLQAPAIVKQIDLSGRSRLLDLGGGPGTYAINFCLENKALAAVVADLPTTRPFAERTIARFGLSQRVLFQPVNYLVEELKGSYDVVWLSHILHAEGPETCRRIVQKAADALDPGGLMCIQEFIMNDQMDGPLFPALFSLNMLLGTENGQSYSEEQLHGMMREAGIEQIERLPYRGPTDSSILVGTKP